MKAHSAFTASPITATAMASLKLISRGLKKRSADSYKIHTPDKAKSIALAKPASGLNLALPKASFSEYSYLRINKKAKKVIERAKACVPICQPSAKRAMELLK